MKSSVAILSLLACIANLQVPWVYAQNDRDNRATFPYQALILNDLATVHSGPGESHYATDELRQNQIVDVYRHDPGGWCAIRPPKGSFSLLPEMSLKEINEHIGEIQEEGAQAWVGTQLGSVEVPLWQVKLDAGERVEILGQVSWPNPEGHSTIWYQIAPPAGEFRWIKMSDLQLPRHMRDVPAPSATSNVNAIRSEFGSDEIGGRDSVRPAGFQDEAAPSTGSLSAPSVRDETINRGWKKASRPIRIADNRVASGPIEPFKIPAIKGPARDDGNSGNETNSETGFSAQGTFVRADPPAKTTPVPRVRELVPPISGPISTRIGELETVLTREMLKPPSQWQLESILKQATAISASSNDSTERNHAQRLIKKIRNCTTIQTGFENVYDTPILADGTASPVGTGLEQRVELGTTYDAYGWLNQLVRDKGRMNPTYVLENDDGQIICHIAPSPGLNLQRYVKNKVGIIGRRGFHQKLQLNHVTAERIIVLDTLRR